MQRVRDMRERATPTFIIILKSYTVSLKKKPRCLLKATKLQTIKRNFIVYELYLNKIVIKNSIILKYKKQFIIHMNCIGKDFPMITHAEESQEWRRKWQPTPVLLPRKFHGWRSLVGYSP